jgi:hypothetical protein
MDTTPQDEGDEHRAGDLLVGAEEILRYLIFLGALPPDADVDDVYYMKRSRRWPIGNDGLKLIASKRRMHRHADRITRGPTAA